MGRLALIGQPSFGSQTDRGNKVFWTTRVLRYLDELVVLARSILKVLRLRQPGMVFLKMISEEGNMLSFVLSLPAAGAADVVNRELVVGVGTAETKTFNLSGDATSSEGLSGEQDDAVVGTLVDVDDAGNRSPASSFSFVLTDTIPPPMPGQVGLKVTAEV